VIVTRGGPGVEVGGDAVDLSPAQTQAATASLMTLIAIAVYVLAVVARPYNWWKVLLLAVSAGAYVLIFAWPFTQDLFHLDSSNWTMNSVALISAVVGIVCVEAVSRVVPRWIARHGSPAEHSAEVEASAV